MKILFILFLEHIYLEDDFEIIESFLTKNTDYEQVIFFIKTNKIRNKISKSFKNFNILIEEYDENEVEETIELFVEDLEAEDCIIVSNSEDNIIDDITFIEDL